VFWVIVAGAAEDNAARRVPTTASAE